jgi:hypothetical protein
VIVIVRVAVWVIAPEPLVEAEAVTVLVPAGVPLFPPTGFLLPPQDSSMVARMRTAAIGTALNARPTDFRRWKRINIATTPDRNVA